ncbi:MAG TPA: hypothetical protein V6C97_21575 [Oculatellaceae cyanobacterium]
MHELGTLVLVLVVLEYNGVAFWGSVKVHGLGTWAQEVHPQPVLRDSQYSYRSHDCVANMYEHSSCDMKPVLCIVSLLLYEIYNADTPFVMHTHTTLSHTHTHTHKLFTQHAFAIYDGMNDDGTS